MKQPRASDFDPNAKERELKELRSPMEDFPVIESPYPNRMQQERSGEDTSLPVHPVRDVPSASVAPADAGGGGRRKIKSRHPFDIYEDQLEELKKLSLEDRMRGGVGSMSAMVREALDGYLAKMRT